MDITFHSSVIFVKNIERSKQFYTQFLNRKVEHDFGKNIIFSGGLSIWEIGSGHVISEKLDTKNVSNRMELYFESPFIEEIFQKLEGQSVKFLHGVHEEPWGQRTIRFFDPDGHLIEVGEPMEVFVANMKAKGLTVQQISDKSGIALETVEKFLL